LKICRFGAARIGEVIDDEVIDITDIVFDLARRTSQSGDELLAALPELIAMPPAARQVGRRWRLADIELRAPVARPGKIIAAPVNYRNHIAEAEADPGVRYGHTITDIQQAGLFLKATSALAGPAENLAIRFPDRRTDYEVELVVLIGKAGRDIPENDALNYVAGYAVGLDITLRGPEDRSFRKSIDGYAIVGPWLTTRDDVEDPNVLDLFLEQNGQIMQQANTSEMVFGVSKLISFASSFYTLEAGDLLFTGTPEGVGPIAPGDVLRASIDGLGEMAITVIGDGG
jgi:2,4-diketo-3-deoxy-L-fuconate hydrolase